MLVATIIPVSRIVTPSASTGVSPSGLKSAASIFIVEHVLNVLIVDVEVFHLVWVLALKCILFISGVPRVAGHGAAAERLVLLRLILILILIVSAQSSVTITSILTVSIAVAPISVWLVYVIIISVLVLVVLFSVDLGFSSWPNSTEDSDLSIHSFEELVLLEVVVALGVHVVVRLCDFSRLDVAVSIDVEETEDPTGV